MGNTDYQIDQRYQFNKGTKQEIVAALQTLFDQHIELIRLIKIALQLLADDYKIVVRADNTPIGQHIS